MSNPRIPAMIGEPSPKAGARKTSLLGLGFRPFFLLAGVGAIVLMGIWLHSWPGGVAGAGAYYGPVVWHAHEMLFGYAAAVVAGFLLTAVPNWTGQPTPSGWPLGALAGLWLAGRILPWFAGVPVSIVAVVDLAFLPCLAWALVKPLWAGRNRANRWFVPLLLGMALANALVHAQAIGYATTTAMPGIFAMLDLVIALLILVGGRIMPFFTEKAIPGAAPRRYGLVERFGVLLPIAMAVLHSLQMPGAWVGAIALVAGLLQGVRLWGWHDRRVWRIPILWVLYAGYGWLALGLLLFGLSELGLFQQSLAIHALTIGALGVFPLGMMTRVALAHTGRAVRSPLPVTIGFLVINLAVLARVLSPILVPSRYLDWVFLAGVLWILGFLVFAVVFTPVLIKARVDGRPDQ